MKLWFNPASPFARKVRIVAREAGLAGKIEEVSVMVSPINPHAELAKENPLVKIPALATPTDGTLYDSDVICEYLDSLGGETLFPAAGTERWRELRLQALADGILEAAVLLRYESAVRPQQYQWGEWIAGQFVKVRGGLDAMERECGGWGERFGIGEITAACVCGYLDFRFTDEKWRDARPRLARWFGAVSKRASVQATVPQ